MTKKPKRRVVEAESSAKPVVWLRSATYQPSNAELEEDMAIDTTHEELARVALQPITVKTIGEDK
jgi:hypothetical protein